MNEKLIRTIKAVSMKQKSNGSIGFLTEEEENRWYNVLGEEPFLDEILKVVSKGNLVEFEMEAGAPVNFKLKEKSKKSKDSKFADDLTSFEDLLNDAHEKFKDKKLNIYTIKIDVDLEKRYALFKAVVKIEDKDGKIEEFHAHGDATSENIQGDFIKPHFIRMAETRAIARALRWATNNASAAAEETTKGKK